MIPRAIWTTTYLYLLVLISAQQLNAAEDLATHVKQATVRIEIKDQTNNVLGTGSGVVVSPQGYILTAHHVIKEYFKAPDTTKVFVRRVGVDLTLQNENRVDIVSSDATVDMALLRLPGENLLFLKVGDSSSVANNAKLTAYGFGVGTETILDKNGSRSGASWETQIPFSEGFSGGPIVLKGCDILIGIARGGLQNANQSMLSGRTIIIPSQHGDHFFKQAKSTKSDSLCSRVGALTGTDPSPFWVVEPDERVELDGNNYEGQFSIRNLSNEDVDWWISKLQKNLFYLDRSDDRGKLPPWTDKDITIGIKNPAVVDLVNGRILNNTFLVESQKPPMEYKLEIVRPKNLSFEVSPPD